MTADQAAHGRAAERPRILLAEDHPAMAAALSALLVTEFDVVDVVRDGQALIDSSRTAKPDVIVSDIAMPGVSGLAAAATLLAGDPDCRIVFVTVMAEREVILKARRLGVLGYVLKCDAGDQLLPVVAAALRGEPSLSSGAQQALNESQAPPGRSQRGCDKA